jgi:ankyrin repeat protein
MSSLEDFAKAIENGDSNQIESLLTSGSIDVNARLPRSLKPPPLVFAMMCAKCDVDIVEMLLGAGAHIDDVDENGMTAVFMATFARRADLLATLLAHRERPNLEIEFDRLRQTPLQLSLKNKLDINFGRITSMLIDAGASLAGVPAEELCWLSSTSTSVIRALFNRGVVINQLRDRRNGTPLHVMAGKHPVATVPAAVKMLIAMCCVDLEARDSVGCTCTLVAVKSGNDIALRCFIEAGADVDVVTTGQTPLHSVPNYKCLVLLLAAGASVNARDRESRTAMQLNDGCNWLSMLPAFIAAGADPCNVSEEAIASVRLQQVESARRDIAKTRLDLVRHRAMQVCIGLQPLQLDALQLCEILQHSFGTLARVIAFHQWWKIATAVKHFRRLD